MHDTDRNSDKIEASKDADITLGVIREYIQTFEGRTGFFSGNLALDMQIYVIYTSTNGIDDHFN